MISTLPIEFLVFVAGLLSGFLVGLIMTICLTISAREDRDVARAERDDLAIALRCIRDSCQRKLDPTNEEE